MIRVRRIVALTALMLAVFAFLGRVSSSAILAQETTGTWSLAPARVAGDWEVFATGSDITDVVVDGSILWAASDGGLLRWDRETGNLVQYLAPDQPLPSNSLSEIELWEGKLYISGYGGLSVFDRDQTWTRYGEAEIGQTLSYHAPMAMVDGVLWVSGEDSLVCLFPDGRWRVAPSDTTHGSGEHVIDLVSRSDSLYVIYRVGATTMDPVRVARYADGQWTTVDEPQRQYYEDSTGALWRYGDDWSKLERSLDQGKTWVKIQSGLRFPRVVAETAEGDVIVASDQALLVMRDGEIVERYDYAAVGPELNYINILEWDDAGRLWIATDGRGLSRYDGTSFTNWQPENSGLRDGAIRGMVVTDERIYAGTYASAGDGGVNILDLKTETWSNLWPGETELSGGGVGGMAVDAAGRAYFPTAAGVLDIWDGTTWSHIPMPGSEGTLPSTSEGFVDSRGHYWVGSGADLLEYSGVGWTIYPLGAAISSLALGEDGRLWVGSDNGLYVRDVDETWRFYNGQRLGVSLGWIGDVAIDPAGRVWLVSLEDLVVFNGSQTYAFDEADAGITGWDNAITFDSAGEPWVGGSFGTLAHFRGELPLSAFSGLTLEPDRSWTADEMAQRNDALVNPFGFDQPNPLVTSNDRPSPTAWWLIGGVAALLSLASIIVIGALAWVLRPGRKE